MKLEEKKKKKKKFSARWSLIEEGNLVVAFDFEDRIA